MRENGQCPRVSNVIRGISHTLAALAGNCPHFRRIWHEALARPQIEGSLAGAWAGEWFSQANGHHGSLRCVLQPLDQVHLRAWFHARYAKFLRVCYSVELRRTQSGSVAHFKGEADLGALAGGVYSYEGDADSQKLQFTYKCRYDHGTFQLQKLGASGSAADHPTAADRPHVASKQAAL